MGEVHYVHEAEYERKANGYEPVQSPIKRPLAMLWIIACAVHMITAK